MCLLVIAHRVHPDLPLVVAGNRDEFHARPASDAAWWDESEAILGGRDLEAGGTWLAVHRTGRFATVTNYRDADRPTARFESRGHLVTEFLGGDADPFDFATSIDGARYAGFNLLAAASGRLVYRSNRGAGARELDPGIYAVANATLDTPWPKVERVRAELGRLIDADSVETETLLEMLADRRTASLPDAGPDTAALPADRAEALSAPFVVMPDYGTRCSTILLQDSSGRFHFTERRFGADGGVTGQSDIEFEPDPK